MFNFYVEAMIQLGATYMISTVKNPDSMRRLAPVLFKVAAVIQAAAERYGMMAELDAQLKKELAKNPAPIQ